MIHVVLLTSIEHRLEAPRPSLTSYNLCQLISDSDQGSCQATNRSILYKFDIMTSAPLFTFLSIFLHWPVVSINCASFVKRICLPLSFRTVSPTSPSWLGNWSRPCPYNVLIQYLLFWTVRFFLSNRLALVMIIRLSLIAKVGGKKYFWKDFVFVTWLLKMRYP